MRAVQLHPHLTFDGRCEAAFRYYQGLLGGELFLLRYRDTPLAESVPAQRREHVIHATLHLGFHVLAGADVAPDDYQPPQGFYVLLDTDDRAEAERLFQALAAEGTVRLPLSKTFWSPAFGVLVDRFGIPWEINCQANTA